MTPIIPICAAQFLLAFAIFSLAILYRRLTKNINDLIKLIDETQGGNMAAFNTIYRHLHDLADAGIELRGRVFPKLNNLDQRIGNLEKSSRRKYTHKDGANSHKPQTDNQSDPTTNEI